MFNPVLNSTNRDPLAKYGEEIAASLYEQGSIKQFQPGAPILEPGDTGETVRFVISGSVSFIINQNEREVSVDTLGEGDVFGEISCLTGSPVPANTKAIADDNVSILEIPAPAFEQILKHHPKLSVIIIKNLAGQILRLDKSVHKNKVRRLALQSIISKQEHVFPDYAVSEYISTHLIEKVEEYARDEKPVLFVGETGVGKELLAHRLFEKGRKFNSIFLFLDLLRTRTEFVPKFLDFTRSEKEDPTEEQMKLFFGFQQPGPDGTELITPGYFELAEDGTLLVRGIEQLSVAMQNSIIEMLHTGVFSKVGSKLQHTAKLRLIATTELDITEFDQERHPLIHELQGRAIIVPPLRKRRREIPGLVNQYVARYCAELGKNAAELSQNTMNSLVNYSWPGNDMELSTTLKRAILVSESGVIGSHDIYFDLKSVERQGKYNLLNSNRLRQALQSPLFPAVFQSAVTPFFFVLLVLLFMGPADPMKNPASLFMWAVGWPVLIIGAFFWARFWCSLCPIGTLSKLAKKVISLEKPLPKFLKNNSDKIIATAVICIIWFETATNIRQSPFNVAILFTVMLCSAVLVAVIFEKQSWCRYMCGLGGMISVLSKASFIELRADRNVCVSQCTSNDCFAGNDKIEGCPFGIVAPKLHSNRFCKLCGLCVKSCPHGAITLNMRMPGNEIWEMQHTNTGTAILIIGMIGGLLTEMVRKTPMYQQFTGLLPIPEIAKFTLVFIGVLIGVNLLSAASTAISRRVFGNTFRDNYSHYGLALLPIALGGFLAFHSYYLINLGVQLPVLLSEYFHFEIFSKLIIRVPPYVTHAFQNLIIGIGLIWSLLIIYKIGRAEGQPNARLVAGIAPHIVTAITLAFLLQNAINHFFYAAG